MKAAGDFGATQGGVQDMTLARDLVETGNVPPADAIIPEAMFSEHDLPIEGEPCSTLLCLRSVMGIAPDADGDQSAWVQIGMSSTINPDTFERPSQTIVATVDVSGSMGWNYGSSGTPGEVSRELLHAIVDELGAGDRFSIVTFGSSTRTVLPLTSCAEQSLIHDKIDDLGTDGSTDMESGMRTAFPLAQGAVGSTDQVRVIVFSDYQPNVGATSASDFQQIAIDGSAQGVGLTLFGIGLGLGPEIMAAMSEIRGANAFSITDPAGVGPLMEDSWPWMVSPIAYDLAVELVPGEGLSLQQSFAFPGETGDPKAALEVATVFLSKRKGAMLVQLEGAGVESFESADAALSLGYETIDGPPISESLSASYDGQELSESGKYMPQQGIAKTVALALLVDGMHRAADLYGSDRDQSLAVMESTVARFELDASEIDDPALDVEVTFANDMLALMQSGAPQGNLYR